MKSAHFSAICTDEWDKSRGDVCALSLTPDSRRELTEDIISEGAFSWRQKLEESPTGLLLTEIFNPITRTSVKITSGDFDTYCVIRVVPIGCRSPSAMT